MLYLFKLRFHRGISFAGQDTLTGNMPGIIHSDTLFSALINQLVKLSPFNKQDLDAFCRSFNGQTPPFRISSAFPFSGSTFYLPKPLGVTTVFMERLKDIPFLPLPLLLDLACGRTIDPATEELDAVKQLFVLYTTPRVTVDRAAAVSNPYQAEGWYIWEGGGLYFLLAVNDTALLPALEAAVDLLGENGLGGDRSVGYGSFTAEKTGIRISSNSPAAAEKAMQPDWETLMTLEAVPGCLFYNLALCFPASNQEAESALYYRLLARKGWILSSSSPVQMKRKECKMFGEGSLFTAEVNGAVADVTPGGFTDHRIYRYGLAMQVPMVRLGLVDEC